MQMNATDQTDPQDCQEINTYSADTQETPDKERHLCPLNLLDEDWPFCHGSRCMAWIALQLPDGTMSNKGRCGLVQRLYIGSMA